MRTASLHCPRHVACVTAVPRQKPKQQQLVGEASAVTAANKYQRTDHLLKLQKRDDNGTGEDGILSISTRTCTTAEQHCYLFIYSKL